MDINKFKSLLNDQMVWPDYYVFKFVVKQDLKEQVLAKLTDHIVSEKASSKGNYISITSKKLVHSADEIVAVYQDVGKIEGVLTL